MKLLIDKYKPKSLNDVKAQDRAISKLKDFVLNFKKGKGLFIHGNIGCGKTSSVYALANDLNYEIFELNSSNLRNAESIENVLGSAVKQQSLFSKGKIILLDEIDCMSSKDRGGLKSIINLIEESNFPIILTANDIELEKLKDLFKKIILLEFNRLDDLDILNVLKEICEKENIEYDLDILNKIVKSSKGDLRGAILDLETSTDNKKLKEVNFDYERHKDENVYNVLKVLFNENDVKKISQSIDLLNVDLMDFSKRILNPVVFSNEDVFYYWLEENLPMLYDKDSLIKSMELLSKLDVYRNRIMRWQYWRYLAYIRDLMVHSSLEQTNKKILMYKKTKRSPKQNRKLWSLVSSKKRIISEKIASKTHSSTRKVMNNLYYYSIICKDDSVKNYLDLEQEEILWLEKQNFV